MEEYKKKLTITKQRKKELKALREFTRRVPELSLKRYKRAIMETDDPDVQVRLQQILKASEAKKVGETAARLVTPYYRRKLPLGVKKLDTKVGEVARKAIHLLAPKGFVKQITKPAGKKGTGKGRGRPSGTYKLRFVPGVGAVRVPTHIYNKMMSAAKAKRRLAAAQKQADVRQQYEAQQMAAEQVAMQQDPRFQQQDAFLEAPDIEHEQEVMDVKQRMLQQQQIQQLQQQIPQRGIVQKAGDVMRRLGAGVNRLGQSRYPPQEFQQEVPGYPSEVRPQVMQQQVRSEPRVTSFSSRSSILNAPNIFNRPEDAVIGFKRRV